jgi:hypothetical protein
LVQTIRLWTWGEIWKVWSTWSRLYLFLDIFSINLGLEQDSESNIFMYLIHEMELSEKMIFLSVFFQEEEDDLFILYGYYLYISCHNYKMYTSSTKYWQTMMSNLFTITRKRILTAFILTYVVMTTSRQIQVRLFLPQC